MCVFVCLAGAGGVGGWRVEGDREEENARLALILAYTSSVGTFSVRLAWILDFKI